MDSAGALMGPLIAATLVYSLRMDLRKIILLSAIPSLAAWLTLWLLKEKSRSAPKKSSPFNPLRDWKKLNLSFKGLLVILLVFTLGNSTDAFLLIRLSQVGVTAVGVMVLWACFSGVKMISAYYGGKLSDAWGRKPLIVSGWFYYALVYLAFALVSGTFATIAIFLAYGVYYGLCEPSEKAFVADLVPKDLRGTSFGYYNLVIGLGALPASLLFGSIGQLWGYPAAFAVGAGLAGLAAILLLFIKARRTS
jgi:MFS family permease